jgi:hypothetical protein
VTVSTTTESAVWRTLCDALIESGPATDDALAALTEQGVAIAAVALAWRDTPRAAALVERGDFSELRAILGAFEEARALLAAPPDERLAHEALTTLLPPDSADFTHRHTIGSLARLLEDEESVLRYEALPAPAIQEFYALLLWLHRPEQVPEFLLRQSQGRIHYIHDAGLYILAARLPETAPVLISILQKITHYWLTSPLALDTAGQILAKLELLEPQQGDMLVRLIGNTLGLGKVEDDHELIVQMLVITKKRMLSLRPLLAVLGERAVRDTPKMTRTWTRRVLRLAPDSIRAEAHYLRILALEGRMEHLPLKRQQHRRRWKERAVPIVRSVEDSLLRESLERRLMPAPRPRRH